MLKFPAPDGTSALGESAPGVIGICRVGPGGLLSIPFVSPGVEAILGVTAEDAAGSPAQALARVLPDDLARVRTSLLEAARTSSPWRGSFRVLHPGKGEPGAGGAEGDHRGFKKRHGASGK